MRLTDLERIRLELFWPLNGSSSRSLNSPLTLIETLIEIGGGQEQLLSRIVKSSYFRRLYIILKICFVGSVSLITRSVRFLLDNLQLSLLS